MRQFLPKALVALVIILLPQFAFGQQARIRITLDPSIEASSRINLTELASRALAGGPTSSLFTLELTKVDPNIDENGLFLKIKVVASSRGPLIQIEQDGEGFKMTQDYVRVTSDRLSSGIPGTTGKISFKDPLSTLTPAGEDIQNSGGVLPNDIYEIRVELYAGNPDLGGMLLDVSTTRLGAQPFEAEVDVNLVQPGDAVGSGVTIATLFPSFVWDGSQNLDYRIIVVEAAGKDANPDALIQAAFSTSPAYVNGAAGTGNLLNFEIVDARISRQTTFTLPPFGVQKLKPGTLYYWQVFAIKRVRNSEQFIQSTIFEFKTEEQESGKAETSSDDALNELYQTLSKLIGDADATRLKNAKFQLVGMENDGQKVVGLQNMLREIERILETGKIKK